MTANPFKTPRESKSVTVTFRMTPTEHVAVSERAKSDGVEIVDLIREGLGIVLDRPVGKKEAKKERRQ